VAKSFENGTLARQALSQSLLRSVRLVGEYRGKEALFSQQSPQVLQALREGAVIESTESSNRIEGVVAPPQRIRDLDARRTEPANRSEQEIAGYRDVLNTIHTNFADMQLTSNLVLQLHGDLFQFVPGGGGRWKSADNDITETRPGGTTVVRFKPLAPHLVPDAMTQLHDRYLAGLETRAVDPLLLVPTNVLDFLCIHPFADGNGPMARLLSLLLMYQAGYEVGQYISLETAIEETKEGTTIPSTHRYRAGMRPGTRSCHGGSILSA
jgi:Fic family protein